MSRRMSRTEAEALATLTTRLRPDWDHPGILSAIGKALHRGGPFDVAHALLTLAEDAQLRSPGLLPVDGRHWLRRDGTPTGPRTSLTQRCPEHPEHYMPHDHGADMTPEQIAEAARLARLQIRPHRTPTPGPQEKP